VKFRIRPRPLIAAIFLATLAVVFAQVPGSFARSASRVRVGETFSGRASYYASTLSGRKTASGETFHQNRYTAASDRFPIGTKVRVTNRKNGRSVDVTIIDRGRGLGYHRIDLSRSAAIQIDLTRREGTVPVEIRVIRIVDGSEAQ
jgi:rare lipoprotein A